MRRICAGTWAGERDCAHRAGEATLGLKPKVGGGAFALQRADASPLGGAADAYA